MPSLDQLMNMLDESNPDPFVLYALAQEHAKHSDHANALLFFDRCLAADRLYCYAYYHKARVLEQLKDLPAVRATLQLGLAAAREARDSHAESEIRGFLDSLD